MGKTARVKQATKVDNNAELLYDAGNLAAFLLKIRNEYEQDYFKIISAIKIVAPFFDDFCLDTTNSGEDILLRWRQRDSEEVLSANQLSDGTLRFICLSTLLLQPTLFQPETIIVDEPELGLHPFSITVLAEIVKSISKSKQIIFSTQSVELLDEFSVEDIVVVNRDNNGTALNRLNEGQLVEWIEKDYSLSDLWKKNIIGGRFSNAGLL